MNQISLVIRREYLERVRRKSFIISTILMPIILIGMMAMPALIAIWSGPEEKTIAVSDASGVIAPALQSTDEVMFITTTEPVDSAKTNDKYDAVLVIGADIVNNTNDVTLYSHDAPSMQTEQFINVQIANIIEQERLAKYNIENLAQIMQDVHANVSLQSFRLGEDEEMATSSLASYIIGLVTMMILYTFIMLYGQMVMNSIIEEKNNRVLEIVVSSVKPSHLMIGKVAGIGLVALTQMLIWALLVFVFTQWGMPSLMGGMLNSGGDIELSGLLSSIGDTGYVMSIFLYLTLFMITGYMFYSAIYAAIGSAVDNVQDAGQLQTFAIVPIMVGMIFSFSVVNDPTSSTAVWLSMIPFTSPMVMMARMPFGVPGWQIATSLLILAASVLVMIWLAAKIYRVGIFMYGKKPTLRDLVRWARYK